MKRQQTGVTIVEIIIVLVIGAGILILGMRQYQMIRLDADIQQTKYNVNMLFQAMASYYGANCFGSINPSTGVVTAAPLNPNSPQFQNPFPINITTDLTNQGFLSTILPVSPIVNSAGPGTNGYVAQFNEYTVDRTICINGTNATGTTPATGCTTATKMGTVVNWKAQIAVLLKDTTKAQQYLSLLAGDCLSTFAGGIVLPCSSNSPGNFVVWERLPSFATPSSQSEFWLTNPTVKQFNQMYTAYPAVYLIGGSPSGVIPSGQPQYFLCGS